MRQGLCSAMRVVGFVAAAAVLHGCDDQKARLLAPTPVVARKVAVAFLDAASGRPIATSLTATVRDADGELSRVTRDGSGGAASTFEVTGGVLAFEVADDATVPLTLTVVGAASGYDSTSVRVEVTGDGSYDRMARMVNIANPPEGVVVAQASAGTANAGGVVQGAGMVATPTEPRSGGSVSFGLPAGTLVTTPSGAPLTGALTATVTYFNNSDTTSLAAFPGGLDVIVPVVGAGGTERGAFISGGFAAIEVRDESGDRAAHFSPPIDLEFAVPAATLNPLTGARVKAGDTIPLWSYDSAMGLWKNEGDFTIASDGAGGLRVEGALSHLTYVNLDWFQGANLCPFPSATLEISGNSALPLLVVVKGDGYYSEQLVTTSTVARLNPVMTIPVVINAYYAGHLVGSVGPFQGLCDQPVPLRVDVSTYVGASCTVRVNRVCTQDATQRAPVGSATVYLLPTTGGSFVGYVAGSTNANGEASFDVAAGIEQTVIVQPLSGETQMSSMLPAAGSNALDFAYMVDCTITGGAGGTVP